MSKPTLLRAVAIAGILITLGVVQAAAGGPVCPPMKCPPPMCYPPAPCPPPMCGPQPMCGPPPCPPPRCRPGALSKICSGTWNLVTGVIALPFDAIDCLLNKCVRRCGPPPMCGPVASCPPPMCAPPLCPPPCPPPVCMPTKCMPPPCGPAYYPPGMMGYGIGPGRPVGAGYGAPRRFRPFAKKKGHRIRVFAEHDQGFFGAYW
jgi:hypothetical protein